MGYALGVDIGTTHVGAAIAVPGGAPIPLELGRRSPVAPAVVFVDVDGSFLVGDAAERRAVAAPERMVRQFKRRAGDAVPLVVGSTPVTIAQLFATVLAWVVSSATAAQGEAPAVVVLTHPADWGEHRLATLRAACVTAQLDRFDLVTEPVAAATHLGRTERFPEGAVLAVCDLGGGTFDVALVRVTASGPMPIGRPRGLAHVGGADIDDAVVHHLLIGSTVDVSATGADVDVVDLLDLRADAVEVKEALSYDSRASARIDLGAERRHVTLTRAELEDAVRPILAPIAAAARAAIVDAGIEPSALEAVVAVGGASRMPLVPALLGAELGVPVRTDPQPKLAVALGAAAIGAEALAAAPTPAPALEVPAAPVVPHVVVPALPSPAASRRPVGLVVAAVVALLAGAAFFLTRGGDDGGEDIAVADGSTTTATTDEPTTTTRRRTDSRAPVTTVPTPSAADIATADPSGFWSVVEATQVGCSGLVGCPESNGQPGFAPGFTILCTATTGCRIQLDSADGVRPDEFQLADTPNGRNASGALPDGYLFNCGDVPSRVRFNIDLSVEEAEFVNGGWRAREMSGTIRLEVLTTADCGGGFEDLAFRATEDH